MIMTDEQMPPIIPLRLGPKDSTRRWKFIRGWYFYFEPLNIVFFIPKGYIINGASIPSWAQGMFSPVGFLFIGSIMHDFFYDKAFYYCLANPYGQHIGGIKACFKKPISKNTADDYLKQISKWIYPEKWVAAGVAHRALSIGGQAAWDTCRKADGTYIAPPSIKTDTNEDWM